MAIGCMIIGGVSGALLGPALGVSRMTGFVIGATAFASAGYLLGMAAISEGGLAIYYTIAHFLPIYFFPLGMIAWSRLNLSRYNGGQSYWELDPAASSLTPEWTRESIKEHINKMKKKVNGNLVDYSPEEKTEALASLEIFFNEADLAMSDEYRTQEACDGYCDLVRNRWLGLTNNNNGGMFRIDKAIFARRDGFHRSNTINILRKNDHAALQITFADGNVALIDNGWFGKCGQTQVGANQNVFGLSNIPINYDFMFFQTTR
jgi:hypothetical protein